MRAVTGKLPTDRWKAGLDNNDGSPREDMTVAEITDLLRERLDRTKWPKNCG